MGSKKHKKHHKSDKKDISFEERSEKPLKLVLKVGGSTSSFQTPNAPASALSPGMHMAAHDTSNSSHLSERKPEKSCSSGHSHEKHKKSKKKKKKKSSEKDKDRHERKRKHHHHHHHHREHSHERKEKRRREQQELSRSVIESQDDCNSLNKSALLDSHIMPSEKPLRDPRSCTLQKKAIKSPLQILLLYTLKKLQMKDPQEFFAWPVTDSIAPGYSSIIQSPIDFSNIKRKIDEREYASVTQFKSDIKLMCDNAMTYNRADTIYYKSARRMWHAAQKLMSRDQLLSMKRNLPYMLDLSSEELGFDINDENEESLPGTEIVTEPSLNAVPEAKKSKAQPSWNYTEADDMDDEMSAEEILAEAQKAAKAAAEKLTLQRPNSKFGFLRQHENGSTTLAILHPKKTGEKAMKVNLEMLSGKLNQGTGTIVGFKEDTKNIIKPAAYNTYGTYSSYAPHFDSMYANLSKEETELVLSTYGDELGMQYADSITTFAKDSDYVLKLVDNMLDVLTGGEHSKTVKILEERRKMREEEEKAKSSDCPVNSNEPKNKDVLSEAESLQALADIDMEISLLEPVDNESASKSKTDAEKAANREEFLRKHKKLLNQRRAIQQKLDNATQLLHDLRKVQNERLSSAPPLHLSLVQGPNPTEMELADKVTKKLTDIALDLPPESVSSMGGIRKALGITYQPVTSSGPQFLKCSQNSGKAEVGSARLTVSNGTEPRDISSLGSSSPAHASSSEDRVPSAEMDTELQHFLETGPMLRVCESPTGS